MIGFSDLDGFHKPSKPSKPSRGGQRAFDLEALLHWVYALQLVGNVGGRDWSRPSAVSGDGAAMVEWFGQMGTLVDRSRGFGVYDVHPDAEAVNAALCGDRDAEPKGIAIEVVRYARANRRPDWWDGPEVWAEPVWRNGVRGRIEGGKVVAGRIEQVYPYKGAPRPVYCRVALVDRRAEAAARRERYAAWHAALVDLLDRLPPLKEHVVTGFTAPARPWEAIAQKSAIQSLTARVGRG